MGGEWGKLIARIRVKEAISKKILMPYPQLGGTDIWCEIKTLEGTMVGNYKDYIIQGVQGEIYPCKPVKL